MKVKDLPKPLQEWLRESKAHHLRVERLYEELRMDPATRGLDWLAVAYELGRTQGRSEARRKQP